MTYDQALWRAALRALQGRVVDALCIAGGAA